MLSKLRCGLEAFWVPLHFFCFFPDLIFPDLILSDFLNLSADLTSILILIFFLLVDPTRIELVTS